MYSIWLAVEDEGEYRKLAAWILEECQENCQLVDEENNIHIAIIEVNKWHDWVKIHRFRKRNKGCRVIPLLDPSLLHTSPLAIEFKLTYLLVKSVKQRIFLRTLKRAVDEIESENTRFAESEEVFHHIGAEQAIGQNDLPFREAFLRRLLSGEVKTEEELLQARFFLSGEAVPNVVCFIQGFVRCPDKRIQEDWQAPTVIQEFLKRQFEGYHLTFLSYRKHLLVLIQVPSEFGSLKHWKEGEGRILATIDSLENEYGIQLYIGVGSIYREPLLLHHSYKEACKARRTSPYERLQLRYYEEITKDMQIQKCTEYIYQYCTEDLSIKQVADQINLSVPYFSRIFKLETGRSFVEYVTFVRMQRAVWLLRHTDHTVEAIAEELGYNTPNYFSGTFKKYVGLSPRDYRATEEIIFV
ncbi:AraC family transcriptional regulator [Mesobacillus boroniphilus]|uniref:AraC family transcriptional regulator n=1 Tax=Mesobacillus boroniphilus TaxID=308892 RepID=A0A944CQ70_9BACI|nr:helix-turn-helix domain-containing protein [Mesobacillus boroniphilus]MBS8266477.1 AraC family transcriptional regulator [Mesobacillus boroniphilus]